eukprot:292313_1
MLQSPADLQQLQTRIQHEFRDFPHLDQLATELVAYFQEHEFDDFKDIVDDIAQGYDECCCKEKLFEVINVTNRDQKIDLYERLKRCLESAEPSPLPSHSILNVGQQNNQDIWTVSKAEDSELDSTWTLISELDFNITKEDVKKTAAICFKHCPFMYQHIIGMAKEFKESDLESYDEDDVRNKISGKALCIVKAIDIKNRKPWLYWLLHIFS